MNFIIEKIWEKYQESGITGTLKALWVTSKDFFWRTNCSIWLERDLERDLHDMQPRAICQVDFSSFDETVYWIRKNTENWYFLPHEVAVAKENGHVFLNVKYENNIVGYMKIGFRDVYVKDFRKTLAFAERTAFVYDTYVDMRFRGKKIAQSMIAKGMIFLRQKGYTRLLCHIEPWNKPSLRAYGNLGFVALKRIRYIKLFGISVLTANPEAL